MTKGTSGHHHAARPAATRVARNTVLRAAAEISGKLASLVLFALIGRQLGAHTLGQYVFALALGQLIWSGAGFGLDQMALRDIARGREAAVEEIFYDIVGVKLFLGILGLGIVVGVVAALSYSGTVVAVVAILGAALVLNLLMETAQTMFQAYERMEYYFAAYLPNKLLTALFGIVVLVAGGGIVVVAFGALIGAAIALALAFLLVRRFPASPKPRLRPAGWPSLLRRSASFGLKETADVVRYRADIVLLSLMTTTATVGFYGAAYRLLEATFFLAWSIGQSVLPMFAYLDNRSDPTLDRVLEGAMKFIAAVLTPVAVVLVVCAEPIIGLIFGLPAYSDAVAVLRWLGPVALVYALVNLLATFTLIHRSGRLIVAVMSSGALLNVALNLALIPSLEAVGSAVATLIAESILLIVLTALAVRVVEPPAWFSSLGVPMVAGAAMALAMLPFRDSLPAALAVGAVVYLGVLATLEARSSRRDMETVREVLRVRRRRPGPATEG